MDIVPDRPEEVGGRNNETPLDELPDEQQEEVIKKLKKKYKLLRLQKILLKKK